ncbi:MAG: XrtA system polysaccharide deacetylase [Kiritimatiellia bacterium]
MRNALSIDVEEWFCVSNFAKIIWPEDWPNMESRIEMQIGRILDILGQHSVKATFFILGWVAERHSEMVRNIALAGHEIATHGYGHQLVSDLTPEQFREDLAWSLRLIREITGIDCRGYRAPSFSIRRDMTWAWEILAEQGIEYDSSVFPVLHDRYGEPDAPRFSYRVWPRNSCSSSEKCGFDGAKPSNAASGVILNSGGLRSARRSEALCEGRVATANQSAKTIIEIPPATVRIAGRNIPVAGGGYLRLYPCWATKQAIQRINREEHAAVVYLHPWELDPGQPRPPVSKLKLWRHHAGIGSLEDKLHRILSDFEFGPLGEVVG